MLQRRTNIMDGVVPVTQRPVNPGDSYIYNFIADTAGTYCRCYTGPPLTWQPDTAYTKLVRTVAFTTVCQHTKHIRLVV